MTEKRGTGERLYRALLHAYPRRFRSENAEDLLEIFRYRRDELLVPAEPPRNAVLGLHRQGRCRLRLERVAAPDRVGELATSRHQFGRGRHEGMERRPQIRGATARAESGIHRDCISDPGARDRREQHGLQRRERAPLPASAVRSTGARSSRPSGLGRWHADLDLVSGVPRYDPDRGRPRIRLRAQRRPSVPGAG